MLDAGRFVNAARERGFGLWTGVPCSYLQPFINYVIGDETLDYVPASNEGDAVAIAAGYQLSGGLAVAMCQNSGLGNAVNPLTSLTYTHRIPLLLIVTLRGEPGGAHDEPQHELMGAITTGMLDMMQIPWVYFPDEEDQIDPCLDVALAWLQREQRPYCLVMRKGSVAPWPAPRLQPPHTPRLAASGEPALISASATRQQMLRVVQQYSSGERDIVLATTGFTGRELYALDDRPNQLYLVGAMGCASSVALGLALARPDLRIVVLDGDGAVLMRLGALTAIAYAAPANLQHVLLDNGQHESTGGQQTVSHSVRLADIAAACGYLAADSLNTPAQLAGWLQFESVPGPRFARVFIRGGVPDDLPRPAVTPVAVTERLRLHIAAIPRTCTR